MIASLIYQCVPVPCDSQRSLERNRSIPHTARRGNRRQEGRERGYYNLHRNLNETLLHLTESFIFVTQISQISQIICCKQLFLFSGRSVRFIIPKEFKSVRSIIPEELNLCDL